MFCRGSCLRTLPSPFPVRLRKPGRDTRPACSGCQLRSPEFSESPGFVPGSDDTPVVFRGINIEKGTFMRKFAGCKHRRLEIIAVTLAVRGRQLLRSVVQLSDQLAVLALTEPRTLRASPGGWING